MHLASDSSIGSLSEMEEAIVQQKWLELFRSARSRMPMWMMWNDRECEHERLRTGMQCSC